MLSSSSSSTEDVLSESKPSPTHPPPQCLSNVPSSAVFDSSPSRSPPLYRKFPFVNIFLSPLLESQFLISHAQFYNTPYLVITSFIGIFMYFQFGLTEDMGYPHWALSAYIVGAYFSLCVACPIVLAIVFRNDFANYRIQKNLDWLVRRRHLRVFSLECYLLAGMVLGSLRFGIHEIDRYGLENPIKASIFYFEIAYVMIIRPRTIVVLIAEVALCIAFTLYAAVMGIPHTNYNLIASLVMYYCFAGCVVLFVAALNRKAREVFLVRMRLEKTRLAIRKANENQITLLENIIPGMFVESIRAEKNRGGRGGRRCSGLGMESPIDVSGVMSDSTIEMMDVVRTSESDGDGSDDDDLDSIRTTVTAVMIGVRSRSLIVKTRPFRQGGLVQTDLINFTSFASSHPTDEIVRVLNLHYSFFDSLTSRFDAVEKVTTVGDCFIAFGEGEPQLSSLLLLGIGFIQAVGVVNALTHHELKLRVGACAAPFVACVYGSSRGRITFDVFGPAVETVNRLEQTASPNCVQVDESLLRLGDQFVIQEKAGSIFEVWGECDMTSVVRDARLRRRLHKVLRRCQTVFCSDLGFLAPGSGFASHSHGLESSRSSSLRSDSDSAEIVPEEVSKLSVIGQVIGKEARLSLLLRESIYGANVFPLDDRDLIEVELQKPVTESGCCRLLCESCVSWCRQPECVSEAGLLYPILTFRRPQDEFEAYQRSFLRGITANRLLYPFWVIYNAGLLIAFVAVRDLATWVQLVNPFYLTTIVAVLVGIISSILVFVVPCFITNILGFAALFLANFFLLKMQQIAIVVSAYLPETYAIRFPHSYFVVMSYLSMCVLCWDQSVHTLFAVVHTIVDLGMIWVCYYATDVVFQGDKGANIWSTINTAQIELILIIPTVIATCAMEYNRKMAWNQQLRVVEQVGRLTQEKRLNENLVESVLPKKIALRLIDLGFRSFSAESVGFVCFLQVVGCFDPFEDFETLADDRFRFLGALLSEFDDVVGRNHFQEVKKHQDIYLFCSPDLRCSGDSVDYLVKTLEIIEECQRRCAEVSVILNQEENKDQEDAVVVVEIELRAGVCHGVFGAGVLGLHKFLWDIFGDAVNLAARLMGVSKNGNVVVSSNNIREFLSSRVIADGLGTFNLKGKGEIECSAIKLRQWGNESTRE